ncbi:MAG: hypothetical protein ACFE68_03365 [Candidatus Hodarchaeota archaeon]
METGEYTDYSIQSIAEQFSKIIKTKERREVLAMNAIINPLSVSVVLPTIARDTNIPDLYNKRLETVRRILKELNRLVNAGYIDEIVIVDGSRNLDGTINHIYMRDILHIAYKEIELFRDEVDMIRRYKSVRNQAERGLFKTIVKIFSQFDTNINLILNYHGIVERIGIEAIPPGKGAALWLTIPICSGDIIGFFDSDNRNFRSNSVIRMFHPIVAGFKEPGKEASVEFIKAFYKRLKISIGEGGTGTFSIGGRVTRLVALPLAIVFAEKFKILKGVEKFKYPLSGEVAATRMVHEKLEYPVDYGVEVMTLAQIVRKLEPERIGETDIEIFQHWSQPEEKTEGMVDQVARGLFSSLTSEELSVIDLKSLIEAYVKEANEGLKRWREAIVPFIEEISEELGMTYSKIPPEKEENRIKRYSEIIERIFNEVKNENKRTKVLPSWNSVTGNMAYESLKQQLETASMRATFRIMELEGLV